jgi:hypothetical protein
MVSTEATSTEAKVFLEVKETETGKKSSAFVTPGA